MDAIHLDRVSQTRYLHLLDREILPLFPDTARKRLRDLEKIVGALERYRKEHGRYPVSKGFDGLFTAWGAAGAEWIRGLVPEYLDMLPRDPRNSTNPKEQYLYRSNGKDYKLIAHNPGDCAKV